MWQRDLTMLFGPGTVLAGKYVVEREVGSGGMGLVLAVRHRELDELYALKLMHPVAATNEASRERFAREAKAAAKLRSEHVARAIDFGFLEDDGPPYMVLELLDGRNLHEVLAQKGPLDPIEVAGWMVEACDAIREAHEHGIIHRDLKPSNLFLAERASASARTVKVLDFGIAKTVAADSGALTKTATTMGSPFYMSPEQMRSAKTADCRSDVWSLGITMYELATGRVPFTGESVTEVAIAVIESAVESPASHRPDLPEAFVSIVMRCLRKNPAHRFQDIDELAEALAAFSNRAWVSRPRTEPRSSTEGSAAATSIPGSLRPDAFASTEGAERSAADAKPSAPTVPGAPALTLLGAASGSTGEGVVRQANEGGGVSKARRASSAGRSVLYGLGGAALVAAGAILFVFRGTRPTTTDTQAANAPPSSSAPSVGSDQFVGRQTISAKGEEGAMGNPNANALSTAARNTSDDPEQQQGYPAPSDSGPVAYDQRAKPPSKTPVKKASKPSLRSTGGTGLQGSSPGKSPPRSEKKQMKARPEKGAGD